MLLTSRSDILMWRILAKFLRITTVLKPASFCSTISRMTSCCSGFSIRNLSGPMFQP
jgi:hypothetical protein